MIDTAIFQLLQSKQPIVDLVGTNVSPLTRRDKDTLPAITYERVSSQRVYNDSGQVTIVDTFFDLNIYGETYGAVTQLAEALEDELKGASGTFGGVKISYVMVMDVGSDDFLPELEIYTARVEVKVTTV